MHFQKTGISWQSSSSLSRIIVSYEHELLESFANTFPSLALSFQEEVETVRLDEIVSGVEAVR